MERNGGVPKGPHTMEKVKSVIINNRFLNEFKLKDFPIKKKIWSGVGMNIEAVFGQFPILKSDEFV